MKALVLKGFGSPDILSYENVPDPSPGKNDLLIKVHAVSVNRVLDVAIRSGKGERYGIKPPHILGVDPSGVVVKTGRNVEGFETGDRVSVTMGMPDGRRFGIECNGGDAELTVAPASCCVKVPKEISFAEATVIARHGPVAYNLLFNMGNLEAGKTALIFGASGNLGSIGIQLAKAAGAIVIAGAGSEQRAAIGYDLGADHVVNYNREDLVEAVMAFTNGEGVDLFYDNIANPDVCPKGIECLKRQGRMVTAGSHGGPIVPINFHTVYHRQISILGNPRSNCADAVPCFESAVNKKLKVIIDRIVPLFEGPVMHSLIEGPEGNKVGKIILDPTLK